MAESFRAVLVSYAKTPGLTSADLAHLKRWVEDDRAEKEWEIIDHAVHEHGLILLVGLFITEMLARRRGAKAMASRAKYRRQTAAAPSSRAT